jgi:hypothetical protein
VVAIDKSDISLGFWVTVGVIAALFVYALLTSLYQKARGGK